MAKAQSLFSNNVTHYEIKKHSSLVQIGNITTLQERKAMNALIRIAKDVLKRDPESKYFSCDIWMVRRLAGVSSNDNEMLKDALRNLKRSEIEYNVLHKDKSEWGIFSFLAEVKIVTKWRWKPTTVSFEFPTTILNVIKHPSMFVKLDLYVIRGLESKHSVALYEVMKDYQNLWYYNCSVDAFRKLMGIEEWQYKIFTMLRQRVLDKAVNEINEKTDIHIAYELLKEWRTFTTIQFKVEQSSPGAEQLTGLESQVVEKLNTFWISEKQIKDLLDLHDHHYLMANIKIVEEAVRKWGVNNSKAYLLKAIQNDYRDSKELQKQEQKAQLKKEQKVDEYKIQEVKAAQKEWFVSMKKKVKELPEEEYASLKEKFLEYVEWNVFFKRVYESKWFEDKVVQIQWFKFVEEEKWN